MLLSSARMKLGHARAHREALLVTSLEWLGTLPQDPMPIDKTVEATDNGGERIQYFVGENSIQVPPSIPLILGDALFNYRAALDHLAWQLVTATGMPKRPEVVYFPIVSQRDKFPDTLLSRMPGISDVIGPIVRQHQPFLNGSQSSKHPLAILNAWNVVDKHRTIPIVVMNAMKVNMEVPADFPNFEIWGAVPKSEPSHLTPGTLLLTITGKRRDPRQDHGVKVLVRGEHAVAHESGLALESALDIIDQAVESVLRDFEALP